MAGCSRAPETFPPPIQRTTPPDVPELKQPVGVLIAMDDSDADEAIVRDVQGRVEGIGWRWTHQYPELRFRLERTENQKLTIDFSFPEQNFKETGPVTVSFFVNGRLLDKVRYTTHGDKHFEKPVPAAWLKAGEYTFFRAAVDPPWIAPTDKARLGFVLFRVGFIE